MLKGIGVPVTPQNVLALQAWQRAEGGTAANNPFNTTQPHPAATDYNSVGVKNYPTPEAGIQATVATLNNGRYGNILQALHQGTSAQAVAQAIASSPWGTGSGVLRVLGAPGAQTVAETAPAPAVAPAPVAPQTQLTIQTQRPTSPLADPVVQGIVASNDKLLGIQAPDFASIPGLQTQVTPQVQQVTPPAVTAPKEATHGSTGQLTYKVAGKITGNVRNALSLAEDYIGTPYSYGGGGPSGPTYGINQGAHTRGFDCSGLLQYMWARAGVSIPRDTYSQFQHGTPVPKSQLQPGDAVFFTGSDPRNGLPGHVGIYIGNGKILQAPHTGATVEVTPLAAMPGYQGARRYG